MDSFDPLTRVAAYPRVSTEEQRRRGLSIDAQIEALQAWADERHLKIVGFYNDAGNSARKSYNKRPAMVRLLEDVKAGKIDLIIFTKLDRWFRNIAEYYKVQEILDAHHVQWKTIFEDYDTSTASGRLKINIMLSVAQDEADRDSERIKDVFANKRSRLEPVTGNLPLGYTIQDKKMIKDPKWEKPLEMYFESILTYHSPQKARTMVFESYGIDIYYKLASNLMTNRAYYGLFNGIQGMCPPYITKAQYDEIQMSKRRAPRKTMENRVYIFSGLVFCGTCGHRYCGSGKIYRRLDGHKSEYVIYNCHNKYYHSACSNSVNIREAEIEEYLIGHVDAVLSEHIIQAEIVDYTAPQNTEQDIAKARKKLLKLKDLYINDLIDLEAYRKDYAALTQELESLTTEAPVKRDFTNLKQLFNENWKELYAQMTRADKQLFWRSSIEKIVVSEDRKITFYFLP